MDQWAGVVLAAGHGKRMKSRLTKVLHRVCGKELVRYPVDLMKESGVTRVVVVVSPGNRQAVQELLGNQVEYVTQTEVKGTGDALSKAKVLLQGQTENVLVLTGDAPL
ncbi:MAG TPA: bifunctional UDP-N-acetylglucosamine diphosphorylase/glucosamine-1-phosphate N-acetyltransferase GlmU, partial [Dehalococcoidia bacterium]|nr:bifunctional UDP-N-acetylglucosamine diphosphorylase/glucosamine-1-phosphate N-acetyltransferase GlmU [Dehalococcoidia bacterium]